MELVDAIVALETKTMAKALVLENAIQQLWITTLANMDDPVGSAEALEAAMLDLVARACEGEDGDLSHHALAANAIFWRAVREGLATSTRVGPGTD